MKRARGVVLAAALLLALASPTAAAQPDRYPIPTDPFVLEGLCEFDVALGVLADKYHETDFYDAEGNLVKSLFNGRLVITLTNLSSGASIEANVGGPGRDVYNADGTVTSIYLGRSIPLITDTNFTRGRFVFVFDSSFEELLEVTMEAGFTEDMCVLLAS